MIQRLRLELLRRQARQTWQNWRHSGSLVIGAYAVVIVLILLVGAWQSYRTPLAAPDPPLVAALVCIWWLSAWLVRRPGFGTSQADELLLRLPAAPHEVLRWPLLLRLSPIGSLSVLGALGLGLWFPTWWTLALAVPSLVAGRFLLLNVIHDARLCGHRRMLAQAGLLSGLPLLGMFQPLLLPLGVLAGVLALFFLWCSLWRDAISPRALRRWQVEGMRQSARRLGLPAPEVEPDGLPAPRRLKVRAVASGPFGAALWRSTLHVLRRRRWLLLALGVMPLLGAGVGLLAAPAAGLDPMLVRSLPLIFALFWSVVLVLLGPESSTVLPLARLLSNLARVLPAGALLGLLSATGAVLSGAGAGTVCAALVVPGVALALLGWLGRTVPGGPVTPASLRFAAACLPTLLVSLCGLTLEGWLAPLLLLALGTAAGWAARS